MVELMVALAVSAILIVGTIVITRHVVIVSATNTDRIMARLQVEYVGFWISEDVQRADEVLYNPTLGYGNLSGDLLHLEWTRSDIDYEVTYRVYPMSEESCMWKLERNQLDSEGGNITSIVAEHLVNESCPDLDWGWTSCNRIEDTNVLKLDVAAMVDESFANSTYMINPRGYVEWGYLYD